MSSRGKVVLGGKFPRHKQFYSKRQSYLLRGRGQKMPDGERMGKLCHQAELTLSVALERQRHGVSGGNQS